MMGLIYHTVSSLFSLLLQSSSRLWGVGVGVGWGGGGVGGGGVEGTVG